MAVYNLAYYWVYDIQGHFHYFTIKFKATAYQCILLILLYEYLFSQDKGYNLDATPAG